MADNGGAYHFFSFRFLLVHLRNFKNDFRPTGIRRVHFRKAEWESFTPPNRISAFYLSFRLTMMFIFIFMLCYSMSCTYANPHYRLFFYFIYFTHWTLSCATFYAILFGVHVAWVKFVHRGTRVGFEEGTQSQEQLADGNSVEPPTPTTNSEQVTSIQVELPEKASTSIVEIATEKEPSHSPPRKFLAFVPHSLNWLEIMIWIFQTPAFTCCYISTLGYWALIFNPVEPFEQECTFAGQIFVHGANALLLTVDLLICAVPVHFTHLLYTTAYGLLYILFSGLYHVLNAEYPDNEHGEQPYIYSFVNWEKYPVATAFLVPIGAFLGLVVLQFFALLLYSIRLWIVSLFKPNVYAEHLYQYEKTQSEKPEVEVNDLNMGGENGVPAMANSESNVGVAQPEEQTDLN